jgi:hypothetical protein
MTERGLLLLALRTEEEDEDATAESSFSRRFALAVHGLRIQVKQRKQGTKDRTGGTRGTPYLSGGSTRLV